MGLNSKIRLNPTESGQRVGSCRLKVAGKGSRETAKGGEGPMGNEITKRTQFLFKKANESAQVSKKTNPISEPKNPVPARRIRFDQGKSNPPT
jgi:hypothetical protein